MSDPSHELDAIIAQYLHALEAGEAIPVDQLMAKYPQHAERLAEFFEDLDRMKKVADGQTESIDLRDIPNSISRKQSRLVAGRYKLLQKIGAGGMGEVWMADQIEPVRRRVALKLIKAGSNNDKIIARFEAERQALALMDHPNIARVLDGGTTDDGQPYFVMELVQGLPVTQYCDKNRLDLVARLQIFGSVCEAVHHAHQKGIIHRDLKPSNILVAVYNGKPVPKVIDFGLAKAWGNQPQLTDKTLFTEFGAVVGTLQYMSPEQAELDAVDIDTRADIYALGVLLYELLTGTTPIERETLEQQAVLRVLQEIRETDPPRPSVRLSSAGNRLSEISNQRQIDSAKLQSELKGDLDWIVMKALEKDRARRYESANSFSSDIHRYLAGDAIEARPPSWRYRFGKTLRRNRLAVSVASAFAILLLVGSGISTLLAIWANQSESIAKQNERIANEESRKARDAEQLAKAAQELEANQRKRSEKLLYRSNVQLALARIEEGSLDLARKLLEETPEELRNIEYWHAESMLDQSKMVLRGHDGPVHCVCFSPDGRLIASGGQDGAIRIWNATTGKEIKKLEGLDGSVKAICFTPDGNTLLSFTFMGKFVSAWDVDSAEIKAKIPTQSIHSICCSANGMRIAVGQLSVDAELKSDDFVVILDGVTYQQVSRCDLVVGNSLDVVHFSLDELELFAGSYVHTLRWDTESGKLLAHTSAEGDQDIDFVKPVEGGKALLTCADYEGVVRTIDPVSLATQKVWQLVKKEIRSLCLDQNDQFLFYTDKDQTIHRFEFSTGESKLLYRGHTGVIQSAACSGSLLATASSDGTIRLWDVSTPRTTPVPNALQLVDSDTAIIAGDYEVEILTTDGKLVSPSPFPPGWGGMAFEHQLITQSYRSVDFFDLRLGKTNLSVECDWESLGSLRCYCPDNDLLALVSGTRINLVSTTGKKPNRALDTPDDATLFPGEKELLSIRFLTSGSELIAVNGRGNVFIWSTASAQLVRSFKIPSFESNHSDVLAVAPGGGEFAIGSGHQICIVNMETGAMKTLDGHTAHVGSVEYSPDGTRIVSMDWSGTVRIWDAVDLQELSVFKNRRDHGRVKFSKSGRQIFSTDKDGGIEVYGEAASLDDKPRFPTILSLTQSVLNEDPRVLLRPVDRQLMIEQMDWNTELISIKIPELTSTDLSKNTSPKAETPAVPPDPTEAWKNGGEIRKQVLEYRAKYFEQVGNNAKSLINADRLTEAVQLLDSKIQLLEFMDTFGRVVLHGERAIAHAKLGNIEQMEKDLSLVDERRIDFNDRPGTYDLMVYYKVIANAQCNRLTEAISELDSEDARYLMGRDTSQELRLWNKLADIGEATNYPRKDELKHRALAVLESRSRNGDLDSEEIENTTDLDSLRRQPEFIYWVWGRSDGALVDINDRINFRRKINAILTLVETNEFGKLIDIESQNHSIVSFLKTEFDFRPANDTSDYRRALAVVGLLKLGSNPWEDFWKSDPSERTLLYLLEMLRRFDVPASEIWKIYSSAQTIVQIEWSLLALANYSADSFESSVRERIATQARQSVADDSQPSTQRAAAHRLLASWFPEEKLFKKPSLVQLPISPSGSEASKTPRNIEFSRTEVTALQYAQFQTEATTSQTTLNLPMSSVTMSEAGQYCNWLSQQDGLPEVQWCYEAKGEPPVFNLKANALELKGYRMPTLAEFENAANYAAIDDSSSLSVVEAVAWTKGNSSFAPQPVALKLPNQAGLFDLLGNIEEWVHPEPESSSTENDYSVARLAGGAVWLPTKHVSKTYSRPESPAFKSPYVGFRVVRTIGH